MIETKGLGAAPLGAVPIGQTQQDAVPAPPGASGLSRHIDPVSREWSIDPDTGNFRQMPSTRQRVMLALGTRRGSAPSNADWGKRRPGVIDGRFIETEIAAVREALQHMTEVERSIRIESIEVEAGFVSNRWQTTVVYTVLGTGEREVVYGG